MRKIINIDKDWDFTVNGNTKKVDLPHCWNSADGTTKDYLRTACVYSKKLSSMQGKVFLVIEGANSVCRVVVDSQTINTHKGGYSTFVTELTPYIKNGCTLQIYVDNSDFEDVYPSTADFTFWGGIYRSVKLIQTSDSHFSFDCGCENGVFATPKKVDDKWFLDINCLVESDYPGLMISCTLLDKDNNIYAHTLSNSRNITLDCKEPVLWDGISNPYLYTLCCELVDGEDVLDSVSVKIGFRSYYIDSEKGFYLNGRRIKLRGVSRHQDRENMGNAITHKEHKEDLDLILEMGANAVRLAHYQQNSYFYDLCDEKGVLVWAEAPIISCFSKLKQDNAKQQLTELVKQNYNHPSIFCWGIENEITQNRKAAKSKLLVPYITELNELVKSLDSTRFTTCAQLSVLDTASPLNKITDIFGYNHYFGWYDFNFDFLNKWLNSFHCEHPYAKLCISEYGAEGLVNLHSANSHQGDYTEEYQCIFHEQYIAAISKRDWIWGSFVWNMFDFGAANRREGGVVGKNNKGLVTYDRKIRKDSYYLYKSYWCNDKFTHICGERYEKRKAGKYDIKVYSNKDTVTLLVNGQSYTQSGNNIFIFKDIEIKLGKNELTANDEHSVILYGCEEDDCSYSIPSEASFVRDWSKKSIEEQKNYLSPQSTVKELVKSRDAHIMVEGKLGKDYLNNPLLKLIYPMKLDNAIKLAKRFGLSDNHCLLLREYTYAIHR